MMNERVGLTPKCRKCGKPLKDKEDLLEARNYCLECAVGLAEEYIPQEERSAPREGPWKRRILVILEVVIIVICLVGIGMYLQRIKGAAPAEQPIRLGTYATDKRTDECIKNLWRISSSLQRGEMPGDPPVCPASKKPYRVERANDNTCVFCPTAEMHRVYEITVSRNNPVPQVKEME